ncbi:hypothetical protein LJR245_007035 [Rhizobium leguminosarum]|uniref:Uncharacterized protein n=1 Tax=Rhizobium ruizarguesonis TaxID=2081791 RepID=A0ACD5EIS2_9HYPH
MIDIIVSDEYLHFKFSLFGRCDDRRSAELLGDQIPQFAAGKKAGKRLPAGNSAGDSRVILTRFYRCNGGGCIYVVQKEILCRPWPTSSIVCGICQHAAVTARTDAQALQS